MLPDWVQKTFGKSKIRLGHLIEILNTSSDSMKFNMNSRAGGPYRELDKLFELRHLRVRYLCILKSRFTKLFKITLCEKYFIAMQ